MPAGVTDSVWQWQFLLD
jgi:hypothetical protein